MKKIILTCLIVAGIAGGLLLQQSSGQDHYGAEFKGLTTVDIKAAANADEALAGSEIALKGKINRQCPSSGCWFFIEDGAGSQIRVELGHLGMKLPARLGHQALIEGRLSKTSEGWQLIGNGVTFGGK